MTIVIYCPTGDTHFFTIRRALEALRKKEISANKASKVYKIPSSTLYKIARKEGIELAQPFNAVATAWNQVRHTELER